MENAEILNDATSRYIKDQCLPDLMPTGEIRLQPLGLIMPKSFPRYLERIRNFEVRPDDVWVISFPKCGTTWTQEMVWLIGNDLDYETAEKVLLLQRCPFLEAVGILSDEQRENDDEEWVFTADTISFTDELSSPRFIKSHLPVSLLPEQIWTKNAKIIYITRNAKDAAVSYYHHYRLWNGYQGSYENFMKAFYEDKVVYSPFWEHVIEYKKAERQHSNILVNSFEEMKKDLPGVIKRTAKFLNRNLTDEQVHKLADHLNFSRMKENRAINGEELIREVKARHGLDNTDTSLHFLRKGEVGSWRKEMPLDIAAKFEEWTSRKIAGTILEGTIE